MESLPNNPEAIGNLALVMVHTGEPGAGVAELERALRLDPAPPASFRSARSELSCISRVSRPSLSEERTSSRLRPENSF